MTRKLLNKYKVKIKLILTYYLFINEIIKRISVVNKHFVKIN